MSFIDVRFPTDISLGATGGPGFNTEVVALGSGFESRNQRWADARCSFDVAKACRTAVMRSRLIAFFRLVQGKTHGFRFKDWSDYKVERAEGVFVATDDDGVYQLAKRYALAGMGTYDRSIKKPFLVSGVYNDADELLSPGVDYTLDMDSGLLTLLNSPPATLGKWLGEFDVPARFDTDQLPLTAETNKFFRATSIAIIELKL